MKLNDNAQLAAVFGGTVIGVIFLLILGFGLGVLILWPFVHIALELAQLGAGMVGFEMFEPTWRHSLVGAGLVACFNLLTSKS